MLIILIPAASLVVWFWRFHTQNGAWKRLCDPHLLEHLTIGPEQKRQKWPLVVLILGLLIAIFALAGPSWQRLPQPVYGQQSPVVILLDLSKNMMAKDIKPSRLARAKFKIIDLLRLRKGGQTALVVFSQAPFIVTPLTEDKATIINLLHVLEPKIMPVSGHHLASALKLGAQLIERNNMSRGDLVVMTNQMADKNALRVARDLASKHITTHVLAVGTSQGAPVTGANGKLLHDRNGNMIVSQLKSEGLKQLARSGHGVYQELSADNRDVDTLLSTFKSSGTQRSEQLTVLWNDEGHWFIFALLPLMLIAFRRGYL